ncbi:hypothetical protein SODALDRAFT_325510 [Sodiomyces alkalinus F11]|uniref:Uncharacterized protein n=1 Tax=Sodiomyces alkalinus (strain CBS 110278 / VKM F-3762 / F11) TaxID=1314773 RepID=A0A3N2PR77_SODAK|nr:hypothetical protein SODALDRAFT_325510 [Sodiomyces alkalinus F11]ROT36954.1 hypothetical protein SODALDRAFT_325510 [Sodiomyces alkalinus F11]
MTTLAAPEDLDTMTVNVDAGQASPEKDDDQTLAIALSTTFSVLAIVLIAGSVFVCWRYKKGSRLFTQRGITPINDEEIESWKRKDDPDTLEKSIVAIEDLTPRTSVKRPANVVVYQAPRPSGEQHSPRSFVLSSADTTGGKKSIDVPPTPVLARAPNARPGLTDETVQGDEAFIPSPRRQTSRLSKYPPPSSAGVAASRRGPGPGPGPGRSRSVRSSFSVGGASVRSQQWYGYGYAHSQGAASRDFTDAELSPRSSQDQFVRPAHHSFQPSSPPFPSSSSSGLPAQHRRDRVHSSSSALGRLSLDDQALVGGLSPRPRVRECEIGRAIG